MLIRLPNATKKKHVEEELEHQRDRGELQARLYAENQHSPADCAASDGHWRQGWHNQTYFKASTPRLPSLVIQKPSDEEASHLSVALLPANAATRDDYFNRSHYEDVLIARVRQLVSEKVWRQRYHTINQFEQIHLATS